MEGIQIESTENAIHIVLDKNCVSMDFLIDLLEQLRVERLAAKIDFPEDIVTVGDDIKKGWWQNHKDSFLKEIHER